MSALHFDEPRFEEIVINKKGRVLIDFWAPWCTPCRMVAPIIDQLSEDLKDSLIVGKIDIDQHPALAARYNVMTIPTLILFQDGVEIKRTIGVQPREQLLEFSK